MAHLNIRSHLSHPMRLTYNHSTKMIEFKLQDNTINNYIFNDGSKGTGYEDGDCGFPNYRNVQVRFNYIYFRNNWTLSYIDQDNFIVNPNGEGVIIAGEYVSRSQTFDLLNPISFNEN